MPSTCVLPPAARLASAGSVLLSEPATMGAVVELLLLQPVMPKVSRTARAVMAAVRLRMVSCFVMFVRTPWAPNRFAAAFACRVFRCRWRGRWCLCWMNLRGSQGGITPWRCKQQISPLRRTRSRPAPVEMTRCGRQRNALESVYAEPSLAGEDRTPLMRAACEAVSSWTA